MRKLLNKMLRIVPLLALILSFAQTNAQRPYAPSAEEDFVITIQNMVQPEGTTNILEFDIYIQDTDPTQDLQMATFQAGINFNLSILAGQATSNTMTTIVSGSSGLPGSMAPISIGTLASGLIRIAGRAAPGCGGGFIIPTTAPGVRVGTFRMTNGNGTAFTSGSTPNFVFTSSTAITPSYATRFAYYAAATCLNTQALITPGGNANVLENPVLNAPSCTPPAVFAVTGGGEYCQGGAGLPVGLAGSELEATYTLYNGAAVVGTFPGTGSALSFGNQMAGTYTVVATKCVPPQTANMTGSAVITETPATTNEFTESACDTYTWALNGATYTVSGDYTYVVGCVTNILHLTITPSSTVELTASACDTYTWAANGTTYTASGDYTFTANCVTNILHLTITPSSTVELTESACDTYTWAANGTTYTVSGDYTYTANCVTNILHLTITPSSTVEFTDAACDTYTWAANGTTYTVSGDYTFTANCVTNILHLTITPSSTVEFTDAACDTYTWAANGTTYTVSGDYTFTANCVTNILHLTITPSSTVEFTDAACDTYTWALNGTTYTVSGDYTYVAGCVTNILHLTITPSSTVEFNEAACDTYTWALNGTTYTVSGDYTYVVGCVTNILHLTITPSGNNVYTESACDSYYWAVSGLTYNVTGVYTFVNGCSTNTLNLTINPSSTVEFTDAACDTYTWALNGMTYTASGDYNYVVGCVTNILHLTITPSSTVEVTASACDTYTWAANGTTYTVSGDYTFTANCVTNILHLTITPTVTPAVSIVASANNVVEGTSVTFTATPVNGGTASYLWFVNGLPAGSNNFQLTYVPLNNDAVYVVMTSSLTCVTAPTATSSSIFMIVTPLTPTGAVWTGLANNGDWFTAGNWDTGVPGAITNVTIPGGLGANYPENAGVCNNLLIQNGGSVKVNPTVGGTVNVESLITGDQYHYISSPVASAQAGINLFDLATYMRAYDETEPNIQWENMVYTDYLAPFTGYSVFSPASVGDQTVSYSAGGLNDGSFTNSGLTFDANSTANYDGYNLLGNPYASRIDLEAGVSLSNVDNAIYFWNPSLNDYSYWVIGGAGVNGASANVPVGQGFFVKVSTPGTGSFGISNAVRTNAVQAFYKSTLNNAVRLKVEGDIYSDETMVLFNQQATSQFDSQFDAYKLKASEVNHMYTKTIDGSELAINTLTSIEQNTSIPVYFEVAHSGMYNITASELETIAGNIPVWLEDLKTGTVQNLRENAVYSFNANVNDNANRFKLTFATLGVDDKPLQNINIWSVGKNIHMQLPVVVKGDVRVINAAGQTLLNTEINAVGEYVIHAPVATGIYMVTITSNEGTVTKKVFVK